MGLSREALVAWEIRVHGPLRGAYVWARGREALQHAFEWPAELQSGGSGDGRWEMGDQVRLQICFPLRRDLRAQT